MPVLHLIVGPNGAGKTTLYERIVGPATHLSFINAYLIARERWPDGAERQAYEAARIAARAPEAAIAKRRTFVAQTVFSHRSKLALIHESKAAGYLVTPRGHGSGRTRCPACGGKGRAGWTLGARG